MSDEVVKICTKCGPLTKDKAYVWQIKSGKRFGRLKSACKKCTRESERLKRLQFPERYKLYGDKFRNIERSEDINELKCSKCQTVKDISLFNKYMLKVRYPYCRDCRIKATKDHHQNEESKLKHKKWYQEVYEPVAKNAYYLKKYNLTFDAYNEMSEKQEHLCLICQKPEIVCTRKDKEIYLHVDHCHETGVVRGLLCRPCNMGLGSFYHSSESLKRAYEYLRAHE